MALNHCGAKRRQVSILQIVWRDIDVHPVARRLRTAINRVVLGGGYHFQILRNVALKTSDKGYAQLSGQVRILTISFLPTPPTGITHQVDIRRPESEPKIDAVVSLFLGLIILGPRLS